MTRNEVKIVDRDYLATLGNCGGYYSCPKDSHGQRLGPLVGYAGKYEGPGGQQLQFVGDIYANFAKAEVKSDALQFFSGRLVGRLTGELGASNIDVLCGAPIGGYALATALGLQTGFDVIKAEKMITALKTSTSREQSELVFSRHDVEKGDRCVIVEDVCNNFSTTGKFVKLINSRGGIVVAIACFLNRSPNVDREYCLSLEGEAKVLQIPVISLVRKVINEWKQDDPAVAEDIAKGNVVWKPKDEWARLMEAMEQNK